MSYLPNPDDITLYQLHQLNQVGSEDVEKVSNIIGAYDCNADEIHIYLVGVNAFLEGREMPDDEEDEENDDMGLPYFLRFYGLTWMEYYKETPIRVIDLMSKNIERLSAVDQLKAAGSAHPSAEYINGLNRKLMTPKQKDQHLYSALLSMGG